MKTQIPKPIKYLGFFGGSKANKPKKIISIVINVAARLAG